MVNADFLHGIFKVGNSDCYPLRKEKWNKDWMGKGSRWIAELRGRGNWRLSIALSYTYWAVSALQGIPFQLSYPSSLPFWFYLTMSMRRNWRKDGVPS